MIEMPSRITLLALLIAFGAVACAPPALDADHANGSSAESTGKSKSKSKSSSKTTDGDDDDDDSTGTPAKKSTTKPAGTTTGGTTTTTGGGTDTPKEPATFAAAYNALKPSCASCHQSGAGGAPTFFGDSEATTYEKFVNAAFIATPSPLVTKGQHNGPPVTADQQSAVEAWVADEPPQ